MELTVWEILLFTSGVATGLFLAVIALLVGINRGIKLITGD